MNIYRVVTMVNENEIIEAERFSIIDGDLCFFNPDCIRVLASGFWADVKVEE